MPCPRHIAVAVAIAAALAAPLPTQTRGAARAARAAPRVDTLDRRVRELADAYLRAYFARYPEDATVNGSRHAQHDALFDTSDSARRGWQWREDAWLDTLRRLDVSRRVGTPGWVTYGVLREKLESDVLLRACRRERWQLAIIDGWLAEYERVAARQPVGSPERRADALARWRRFPARVDAEIDFLRDGVREGRTAPAIVARKVVEQLDALLAVPVELSSFASPARRDDDPVFRETFLAVVRDSVLPAVRAYRDFLAVEYALRARTSLGVGALPDGDGCFRAMVRRYTSLPWGAAELDSAGRMLLEEAERERSSEAATRYGVREGRRLMQQLSLDPHYTVRSTDEMLRVSQDALTRAQREVPHWFGHVPTGLDARVDTFPASVGPAGPSGQAFISVGARAEARYFINPAHLRDAGGKLMIEQLAFHEAVPGHLLQGLLQLERTGAHPVTRYFWHPALGEGWGTYAQELASEMGLYSEEAYRIPLLDLRVLTGVTLVVTAGLHAHDWTREQALDTLAAHLAWSPERLEYQVDFLVGAPAQAASYGAGVLEIRRLRAEAERALGPRFDVRRFHDELLCDGTVPLLMLRAKIASWIAAERRAAAPTSGR
ncbi:MAG TPA: DUF885 family protein [Gemmatimonadaceae bacterium]|nr:DUF885 family protein [Gemmatimonadaceae bacterium]